MPKKQRNNRHLRSVPTQRSHGPSIEAEAQPLIQSLRVALRSGEPLHLLSTVSSIMSATDPRNDNPFTTEARPTLPELVETLVGTPLAETTASLHVIRALTTDELTRARITVELGRRRHPMPPWLTRLGEATAEPDVWLLTHIQGDGDDYFLQVTLATGEPVSALIYVDHNLGTVVKDAFGIDQPLQDVVIEVGTRLDRPDQTLTRTDPAHARAVVEMAIEQGARTFPPPESDTWPAIRPLVEWMLRLLPEGGAVPELKEWTEEETADIIAEFLASPFGKPFAGDHDARGLVDNLLWFGTGYATCDPFRWSPVSVEILMLDWFPRKIMASVPHLSRMPEVLRAFIRYAHDRTAIPAHLTADTLAAVDHWEPDYQRTIRTDRRTGPAAIAAALLERIEAGDLPASMLDGEGLALSELGPDESYLGSLDDDDESWEEYVQQELARAVGGAQPLASLTTEPLPDEPFDWEGVTPDIQPTIQKVLAECDRCADDLFDVEMRTAMRRLVRRLAVTDANLFRRRSSTLRTAATIAWLSSRANRDPGRITSTAPTRDLLARFGVKGSVSERAETFLHALGTWSAYGTPALGSPDLLTSRARAALITARDRNRLW